MFRWRKKRSHAALIVEDTKQTLRSVATLGAPEQKKMAAAVATDIMSALQYIEKTPGPTSPERDAAVRSIVSRATENRQLAVARGATTHADPAWATAALFESWAMMNTGVFPRSQAETVQSLVFGWIGSVLTKDDLDGIEKDVSGRT